MKRRKRCQSTRGGNECDLVSDLRPPCAAALGMMKRMMMNKGPTRTLPGDRVRIVTMRWRGRGDEADGGDDDAKDDGQPPSLLRLFHRSGIGLMKKKSSNHPRSANHSQKRIWFVGKVLFCRQRDPLMQRMIVIHPPPPILLPPIGCFS